MKTLCITVRFLDDRFHGQGNDGPEWPPSPFRLFQAMISAASLNGYANDEPFQWLERLTPPIILAPSVQQLGSRTMYVPNNDSDKKLDRQDRLAEKIVRPLKIQDDESICYLWHIQPEELDVAMAAASQARRIMALGWGIDLVAADGKILSLEETNLLIQNHRGQRWLPVAKSHHMLRCPKPGSLEDLRNAYRSFLSRFEGNVYHPARKPTTFEETPYAKIGSVKRAIAAFQLIQPDDDSETVKPFDVRKTMEIAAWVRGFLCKASQQYKFPGDSAVYVAGHVPKLQKNGKTPDRFSYLPVPSIGHEHADGMIRRLIVAEPYGGNGQYTYWAQNVLSNAVLTDQNGYPQAILRPIRQPSRDSVIFQYIDSAETFQTVTPVILPGYDDMKYTKAQKLIEKALHQAGFSVDDLAEPIYLQKAPFRKGGYSPSSYAVPKYLRGKPGMHVQLRFKERIDGPIAIGAGRHFGLGLFAAVKT